ncbi:F-box domain-containing protein [Favolaschia claudopus]|uniref:F-box domain-containing protein n=1 Tax=Favolaschia claudopus TaxID=2862362 RepID=A0AAW0C1K9_9AGAR
MPLDTQDMNESHSHYEEDWASLSQFKGLPGTRRHNLLHSNEAPFDTELTDFRNVIRKTGTPLARLDDEIARTRRHLQDLEDRRAELWSFREQNRGVLSPLRRVPLEVLGEIFQWALPLPQDSPLRKGFRISDSPWNLTHVCRRWRDVAISAPSLWSLVAIKYGDDSKSSLWSYPLPMVETQIERAQSHGLRIHFYGSEVANSESQIQVLECLMQYMSRWEDLSIGLTSFLYPILESVDDQLSLLRRVWVEWMCLESQQSAGPITAFQRAPSLCNVAVCNEHMYTPVFLPIEQLTRYQLNAPWNSHRDILALAPNLVEAHIAVAYDEEDDWPTPPRSDGKFLQLSLLKRLFVSHLEILQYVTFPVLEEIAVGIDSDEVDAIPKYLEPSISRSSCTLRSLCIVGCPISCATLVQFPSVTEFKIIVDNDESSFETLNRLLVDLTLASLDAEQTIVAPQLREISIGHKLEEREFIFAPYLAMLESRHKTRDSALYAAHLYIVSKATTRDTASQDRMRALRTNRLRLGYKEGRSANHALMDWNFATTWC